MRVLVSLSCLLFWLTGAQCGILDPRHATRREQISLDGIWKFSLEPSNDVRDLYFNTNYADIDLVPVPSSYNDLATNPLIRDFAGIARYQNRFLVPASWENKRVWLRFGSVTYAAQVYINNELAFSHDIGHLPFVAEVTSFVKLGEDNDIVVLVDNVLTNSTIPQGTLQHYEGEPPQLEYLFDYFHYAGIDRPVVLYATENTYIDDITIKTKVEGDSAIVSYDVVVEGSTRFTNLITILDREYKEVVSNAGNRLSGDLEIKNVNLWWPYLMHDDPGYLYTLRVDLFDTDNNILDRYEQFFGVRELSWDSTSFTINGKPIYIRGFGRHEDTDTHGRGLDLPMVLRDHNLIKWIGANSYRTSHYPYAEEIMDLTDRLGLLIIDEVPAISLSGFSDELLENHKASITQLIQRDKNRPSVIMWSAANEPGTDDPASEDYFRQVVAHLKSLDVSRPVTIPSHTAASIDYSGQFMDIICFNMYVGWYVGGTRLNLIKSTISEEAETWHSKYNKPVMMTEYGADTMEGFHSLPDMIWSEEYQTDLMAHHFQTFDELREKGWFIGEMIWNFADFNSQQAFFRVSGNKKGLFTRQRQPKQSAHLIRRRYWALAAELDNATVPTDVDDYISRNGAKVKIEL